MQSFFQLPYIPICKTNSGVKDVKINLTKMSRDELIELQSNIQQALKDLEVRQREEARAAAEEAAAKFGFSLSDLTGQGKAKGKAGRAPAVAKYANPADSAQTWSGRGRQPGWFKAALDGGATAESMAI